MSCAEVPGMGGAAWRPGPAAGGGLARGCVHVWLLDCRRAPGRGLETLDDAERCRAARYRFAPDRERFVARRAALREVLSGYLGCAPGEIALEVGERGKPRLAARHGPDLRFNLSHSRGRALLAVARGMELGVDLEAIDAGRAGMDLARRYFAPGEVRALEALTGAARTRAFFHCWTRKEAFVKATGEGLSRALDSFEVSLLPGESARLRRVAGCEGPPWPWQLADLPGIPGCAGALAAAGPVGELLTFSAADDWRRAGD